MKKGDAGENRLRPCGRKWKLFFVYSVPAISCLAFLPLILAGCANPGNDKPHASAKVAPPATQSGNSDKPTVAQSGNDKPILVYQCQTGNGKPLTSAQATQLATLLANNKAAAIYHCLPFHDGQPAAFVNGHWHWKQTVPGDYEAIVDLASDGSTNRVMVNLLNSTMMGVP